MNQDLSPVYNIQEISSKVSPIIWENWDILAQKLKHGYLILWQHHGIFTGKINDGAIQWLTKEHQPVQSETHIIRLRAFNETQEYHFWRSSGQLQGRLRMDGEGETTEFVDTLMVLRGIVASSLFKESAVEKDEKILLKTRNYVSENSSFQAGYVDSRFVKFDLIAFK